MSESREKVQSAGAPAGGGSRPVLHVAPSPHLFDRAVTTRRMMLDVIIALVPVMVASVYVFRLYAVKHIALCVVSCMVFEAVFTRLRSRPVTLGDGSAVVTGLILAFSLPGAAPWYVSVIGSLMAMLIGKVLFGGLGENIFNPAMVGRAFVMLAFAQAVGASGYKLAVPAAPAGPAAGPAAKAAAPAGRVLVGDAITRATPMTVAKKAARGEKLAPGERLATAWTLFLGKTNGSLGETSALACLLGGLYLVLRRTASWQIPAGVLSAVAVIAGILQLAGSPRMGVLEHLFGGALMFGAFFIATDPVTSPLTPKGKFIFGLGVGAVVMLLRTLSNYPEGVMFAVLLMNAAVPLINRWTVPVPLGGPVPQARPQNA
ncbi:MAG: RnfABCDGE type electron transport complex subunit D [Planctomycetes bacterium]|nr:RnfABCDGE type electron transport complex subunit D [Planctomycetota bacterium]